MQSFELVQPFEIDDDSLDSLSRQECFSLGVEWRMFYDRLDSGKPFTSLVLANNASRLAKAERCNRFVEHRPASDGWAELTVGGYRV